MLQCVAVQFEVENPTPAALSTPTPQHTTVQQTTLQHTTASCSTRQKTTTQCTTATKPYTVIQQTQCNTSTHYNSLHHTTTHCNSLYLTATHCNTQDNLKQLEVENQEMRELQRSESSQLKKDNTKLKADLVRTQVCFCESATRCNTLQHTATHIAKHCTTKFKTDLASAQCNAL